MTLMRQSSIDQMKRIYNEIKKDGGDINDKVKKGETKSETKMGNSLWIDNPFAEKRNKIARVEDYVKIDIPDPKKQNENMKNLNENLDNPSDIKNEIVYLYKDLSKNNKFELNNFIDSILSNYDETYSDDETIENVRNSDLNKKLEFILIMDDENSEDNLNTIYDYIIDDLLTENRNISVLSYDKFNVNENKENYDNYDKIIKIIDLLENSNNEILQKLYLLTLKEYNFEENIDNYLNGLINIQEKGGEKAIDSLYNLMEQELIGESFSSDYAKIDREMKTIKNWSNYNNQNNIPMREVLRGRQVQIGEKVGYIQRIIGTNIVVEIDGENQNVSLKEIIKNYKPVKEKNIVVNTTLSGPGVKGDIEIKQFKDITGKIPNEKVKKD